MPDTDHPSEVVISVTADEEARLRAALRAAGLPAEGGVETLVRETLRLRMAQFIGCRDQPGRLIAFEKTRDS